MLDLRVKTRIGSTLLDKQKIYFLCHEADFSRCFPEITEELLKNWDLAILYTAPAENGAEMSAAEFSELKEYLKNVQLLVVAVTKQFLQDDSCNWHSLFQFALDQKIPVLPLTPTLLPEEDRGLGSAFSAFSRDNIQLLDRNRTYSIPYEKKLEDFLASILIKDQQLAEIRNAFSCRFFLSYRKEDRQYADELLRLVHNHTLCWDTAVWYDEFLQPGKNYQNQIFTRLETADLFLLTVTPLIHSPRADGSENFVVTDEYPAALSLNKPVFPVAMKALSADERQELLKKLPNLPALVPAEDPDFAAALSAAVSSLPGFTQKSPTPERLYLMGLAYLNGIDVETDRERAVRLIRQAAEEKWYPALEKLAEMYRTGQGVAQDLQESLHWRERMAQQRRDDPAEAIRIYEKQLDGIREMFHGGKLSDKYAYKLMTASMTLERMCLDIMDSMNYTRMGHRHALPFLALSLDYTRLHYELDPVPPVAEVLITSLDQISIQYEYLDMPEKAIDTSAESCSLAEDLIEACDGTYERIAGCYLKNDLLLEQASRYQRLGILLRRLRRIQEAETSFRKCLQIYRNHFPYSEDTADLENQVKCYTCLGSLLSRDSEERLKCYEKAYYLNHKILWPTLQRFAFSCTYLFNSGPEKVNKMIELGNLLEIYSPISEEQYLEDFRILSSLFEKPFSSELCRKACRHLKAIIPKGYTSQKYHEAFQQIEHLASSSSRESSEEDLQARQVITELLNRYLQTRKQVMYNREGYFWWYQYWHSLYWDLIQYVLNKSLLDSTEHDVLMELFALRRTLNREYLEAALDCEIQNDMAQAMRYRQKIL